jgi:hypothetical protein
MIRCHGSMLLTPVNAILLAFFCVHVILHWICQFIAKDAGTFIVASDLMCFAWLLLAHCKLSNGSRPSKWWLTLDMHFISFLI